MSKTTTFRLVKHSLVSLLGPKYIDAVVAAQARLAGRSAHALRRIAETEVDFFPRASQGRLLRLLPRVGGDFSAPLRRSPAGASTKAFDAASSLGLAPLTGWGYFRVGEDGRLFLTAKSEHYHAPLGHGFAGYKLIQHAHQLGIPNATHNNTRGYIVRLLEGELIRTANGIAGSDRTALDRIVRSRSVTVLNRVLNLQTGSLAAETAIKIMLGRFYSAQPGSPGPKYQGRVPVLVAIGDDDGEMMGNYHGTTIFAQIMRGMWPGVLNAFDGSGILKVVTVRANRIDDVREALRRYERSPFKIAGFCHELVMMNYGARLLKKTFLRSCYSLCRKHDVPTFVDEIQSCLWSPELYMFREYGIRPDLVAIGKGFAGGEYAASRILLNGRLDFLPQFGSLVTNAQEELSSLAYLITMKWALKNRAITRAVGDYYVRRLNELVCAHGDVLRAAEGRRHMAGLCFRDLAAAKSFVRLLRDRGIDISVQTYKASCPPTALTKLPLIAGYEVVDFLVDRMAAALGQEVKRPGRVRNASNDS
jgi:acetylornithine/succinyldiaminopimelate/putrescine aminotransferase